jgi:esterase/lipase superfamily enzyme
MATPKLIVIFAALSLSLACFSCAGRPSQGVLVPVAEAPVGTSRVRVLVATTRQRSSADDGEMFSGDRGDATSYAAITVSVPPNLAHKVGQIQWPSTVPGDPSRDFVTVSADYIDKPAFLASISAEARQPSHGKVVVFVHGFNTRFDDAVYRFVQIVYDSKSPAVPVLFTWPSRGEMKLRAYNYDRESANYSRDALEELLDNLGRNPGVSEINILAHSMGNWVTLEALRSRYIRPGRATDKIKNVMLVAPDVDIDVFRTQIRRMGPKRPQFSLFVSQDDQALSLSKTIWGGMPRLGDINPEQDPYRTELAQDRIEVYDLTALKKSGDDAHGRAFQDITSVAGMIKERLREGQEMTETKSVMDE